jgi:hypothetical protein
MRFTLPRIQPAVLALMFFALSAPVQPPLLERSHRFVVQVYPCSFITSQTGDDG